MTSRKHNSQPAAEERSVAEILRGFPRARRAALLRASENEILHLLETTHAAVGFPKNDGRWNSQLCLSLEGVRKRVIEVTNAELKQGA